MRLLLATVTAVLLLVSPAFASNVTITGVDNATPSSARGARTIYVVSFTTSAQGALAGSDTVTLQFPSGTGFDGWRGGELRSASNGAATIGSCTHSGTTVECGLSSGRTITAGDAVTVTARGVTNAGNVPQPQLGVFTSKDADVATSAVYPAPVAGNLSAVTVDNTVPSTAAGARTVYTVRFTASATGGLSGQANSEIVIGMPPLTGYAGWAGGTVRDVTAGADVGSCYSQSAGVFRCYLSASAAVAANATVEVQLRGIANTTSAGTGTQLSVSTTSDPSSQPSQPFTVSAATAGVSGVSVLNATPTAAAGGRTRYSVAYAAAADGGLSAAANSRIFVTFPAGTTFGGWSGGTVSYAGEIVGSCYTPVDRVSECYLSANRAIPGGATVELDFPAVTNPPAGDGHTVSLRTTSDLVPVPSAPFTTVPAGTLGGVTVDHASPSAAGGARTRYVVGFTTSATGSLSARANSRIFVRFPAGASFEGWAGGTVRHDFEPVGYCYAPVDLVSECYLSASTSAIPAGGTVAITFSGVTNPAAGANHRVAVTTTSDPDEIQSPPYTVVPGGSLASVTVAAGSLEPSARTGYEVRATTSATGGLASDANSRLWVTFPAGTTFDGWRTATVKLGATPVGYCYAPDELVSECYLSSGAAIPAATPLTIAFPVVTNPATGASGKTVAVATTSDPASVTSAPFDDGGPTPTPTATTTPTPVATVAVTPVPTVVVAQVTPTPTPRPGGIGAAPAGGTVQVCPPREPCHTLAPGEPIPSGATVDTRKGKVELTAPDGGVATFSQGRFKLTRAGGYLELTLNEPLAACPKARRATVSAKKPKLRKLWGDGKGKFRTKGRYSAATVRGTRWLVQDSCAGTLTRVTRGAVSVRDSVAKKTILLRAPKSYLAKPRRR